MKHYFTRMKLIYQVFLLLIFTLPSNLSAQNCCDSTHMFLVPDTALTDSCTGFIYLQIDSGDTCFSSVTTSGGYGSILWDDSLKAYVQRYNIDKASTGIIYGYFRNANGDTLCTRSDTVFCFCCTGVSIYNYPNANREDSCCGYVYFKIDSTNTCLEGDSMVLSITGIDGDPVWDEFQNAYRLPYCIAAPGGLEVSCDLTNQYGQLICSKTLNINCDITVCCDSITIVDIPGGLGSSETECCGTIHVQLSDPLDCTVIGYYVNGSYYNINTDYNYCIPLNTSLLLYYYIIGAGGDTLCVKVYEKVCQDTTENPAPSRPIDIDDIDIYPNPASSKVTIEGLFPQNKSLDIVIMNDQGQEVYKGKNIQLTDDKLKKTIDLDLFANGIYIIKITAQQDVVLKRFSLHK